ncbi:winged helix-turn-helix domain-containing protein [Streptomyces yatensis]|uniref:OmpR/PhoB-type domain-containing protein n=1 Tax=Streptomyces yatensis TaxID=155177 RepID=A0ABN2IMM7_9ACTN|nr:winged helix-turn-helix domain-containing protein [Streptomyces yatensis]
MQALRTRNRRREEPSPRYADLPLDDTTRQARRGRRALELTPAEFRLLRYLLVNAGQVLSKEQIGEHLWVADHRRYEARGEATGFPPHGHFQGSACRAARRWLMMGEPCTSRMRLSARRRPLSGRRCSLLPAPYWGSAPII